MNQEAVYFLALNRLGCAKHGLRSVPAAANVSDLVMEMMQGLQSFYDMTDRYWAMHDGRLLSFPSMSRCLLFMHVCTREWKSCAATQYQIELVQLIAT